MKARPWVGAWAWVEGEARAALLGSEQLQEGVWLPQWFAATPHPSLLHPRRSEHRPRRQLWVAWGEEEPGLGRCAGPRIAQ